MQGYIGEQITGPGEYLGENVWSYVYLDGQVVHLRGFEGHGLNSTQREAITEFFGGCDWDGPPPGQCDGDVTGDSYVGVEDILLVLESWGNTGAGVGDANGDGQINVDDLLLVIAHFGQACP